MPRVTELKIVYVGPDAGGVWLPVDGTHFPLGEAVSVPKALADSLLEQETFVIHKNSEGKNGQGTDPR